jgi:hypothetical protein
MKICFREGHRFSDFLWFVALGGVPEIVACFAIADKSLAWMGGYLGFMLLFGVAEVRFLCRHCPYYNQHSGRTVHCKAMWGPTKWFKHKPGALGSLDKMMLYLFFLLAFSFPIYWLVLRPEFLALYLLSIIIMIWTLGRYECNRCMFFGCPFNRVDKATRDSFLESEKRSQCTSCK